MLNERTVIYLVSASGNRAGAALLRELTDAAIFQEPQALATAIKALPIRLVRPRPLDEAISSAGGVPFEALDANLMLRQLPARRVPARKLPARRPAGPVRPAF